MQSGRPRIGRAPMTSSLNDALEVDCLQRAATEVGLNLQVVSTWRARRERLRFWVAPMSGQIVTGFLGLWLVARAKGEGALYMRQSAVIVVIVLLTVPFSSMVWWAMHRSAVFWVVLPRALTKSLQLPTHPQPMQVKHTTMIFRDSDGLSLRPRSRPTSESPYVPSVRLPDAGLRLTVRCTRAGVVCGVVLEGSVGPVDVPAGGQLRRLCRVSRGG